MVKVPLDVIGLPDMLIPVPAVAATEVTVPTDTAPVCPLTEVTRLLWSIFCQTVPLNINQSPICQSVTLSFWVRSSLTGTFGGSIENNANNRSYPFSYTISSANTWTQISVTIAGDTSGTWIGATNGIGAKVWFSLGAGSTVSTTAGAWASGDYQSATGTTSVVGTNGATWYITGTQLEVGSTATSFDYRPYGTELALCQRYCYKIATSGGYSAYATTGMFISTTRVDFPILLPTYMRASPTATYTAANTYLPSSAGTDFTPSAVATAGGSASPQAITVSFTVSGATAGRAATLTDLNTASSNMIFSAEL